jgi:hypothetical protein
MSGVKDDLSMAIALLNYEVLFDAVIACAMPQSHC